MNFFLRASEDPCIFPGEATSVRVQTNVRARAPCLFPLLSACNCIDIVRPSEPFLPRPPSYAGPDPNRPNPRSDAHPTRSSKAHPAGAPWRSRTSLSPRHTRPPLHTLQHPPTHTPFPSPSSPAHRLTIRSYHANPSPPNPPAAHHPQHHLHPYASLAALCVASPSRPSAHFRPPTTSSRSSTQRDVDPSTSAATNRPTRGSKIQLPLRAVTLAPAQRDHPPRSLSPRASLACLKARSLS